MNISDIVAGIQGVSEEFLNKAKDLTAQLVMPSRALGEIHIIGERLCGIRRTLRPSVNKKVFLVMAGDHGIAGSGVSAYPQSVTGEMVKTFLKGGAGINVLARQLRAQVVVMDAGIIPDIPDRFSEGGRLVSRKIARGTGDFSKGPAMTREQAISSIFNGYLLAMEIFEQGAEIIGTGDMGIGNTSPSSAIGAVITGAPVEKMTGKGTGVNEQGLSRKCATIKQGLEINNPDAADPLDVLSKLGGFEIGAIAGAILAAASVERPVVIDGFISGAGALIAHGLCPDVTDYIFAGHQSAEQGHQVMLRHLGLSPIVNLGMRLGEGTGAALAMHIIEAAARILGEMATFEEAGVSRE